jgi:hypothetical protein
MKIDNRDLTGAAPVQPGRSQDAQKPAGAAQSPSGTAAGDRVELSSGLASVSRALAAYGSDHAGKVQQLTTQVQSGNYNPSSLAISQGIVAQALTGGAS